MVRHTLKSLGPKVLATRQVRDYVRAALRPGGPHVARAQRRLRTVPASSRSGSSGSAPPGRSSGSSTSSPKASATRPRSARPSPYAPSCPSGTWRRRRRGAGRARQDQRRGRAARREHVASMHAAESYDGNRHRFDADVRARPARARSATRSGWSRATPRSRRLPSWAWSPYPPDGPAPARVPGHPTFACRLAAWSGALAAWSGG